VPSRYDSEAIVNMDASLNESDEVWQCCQAGRIAIAGEFSHLLFAAPTDFDTYHDPR
jgi:hypothetical protein